MTRTRLTHWFDSVLRAGAIAAVSVGFVACSDGVASVEAGAPSADTQALVNAFNAALTDDSINEGETTNLQINLLCVDNNTQDANVFIDWADGGAPQQVFFASAGFIANTGACPGAGNFEVCGPADPCALVPHTYANNVPPGSSVTASAVHGIGNSNQTLPITVSNLNPSVSLVTIAGGITEGSTVAVEVQVTDPAGASVLGEIATVTIDLAPSATSVPSTVTCTCGVGGGLTCSNGFNAAVCENQTIPVSTTFTDDGVYTATVTVTDRDGGSGSGTSANHTIFNSAPNSPVILISDSDADDDGRGFGYADSATSPAPGTPVAVLEGFQYLYEYGITDPGTDALTWDWSFAAGAQVGSGAGTITVASRPNLAAGATGLSDLFAWDDSVAITDQNLDFSIDDDDLGNTVSERFFEVQDVDPQVDDFSVSAGSTSPNEGTSTTFSVTARSGDFGSGFDPLDPVDRFNWFAQSSGPPPGLPVITADSNFSGSVTGGDEDYYEVRNTSLAPVLVNFNVQGCTGDPMITVRDSSGNFVVFNDDFFGLCSNLDFTIPAQSTIYVGVMGFADSSSSTYTLRVRYPTPSGPVVGAEAEPNDDGSVASGQGFEGGDFDTLGPVDALADGSANSQYTITAGCTLVSSTCTIGWLDNDPRARFDVFVAVNDEDSTTTTSPISVEVQNVPVAITSFSATNTLNEGDTASVSVTIADPAATLDGPYTLRVQYGDTGSNEDSAVLVTPGVFGTQTFTFPDNDACGGSPNGTCVVTITACEAGGLICDVETSSVNVANVPPTADAIDPSGVTLVEGVAFSTNGAFSDPAGSLDDDYTFNWTWNDGAVAEETGVDTTTFASQGVDVVNAGVFDNVPAAGLLGVTLTLSVTDEDGASDIDTTTVAVRDNVPTISIDDVLVDNGGFEVATPTVELTFAAETASDLIDRLVVTWGDGTSNIYRGDCTGFGATCIVTGGITGTTGGSLSITKPAPYTDSDGNFPATPAVTNPFTITATVHDEDSSAVDSDVAVVGNVAPTLVSVNPPGPLLISEGQAAAFIITSTDVAVPDRPDLLTTIVWADGTTDVINGSDDGLGNEVVRVNHVYTNPGTYDVEVFVTDKELGRSASTFVQIDVLNIAPVITDVFNTGPVFEAEEVTTVALVDNRGADVLDYTFANDCNALDGVTDADFVAAVPTSSAVNLHTYADDDADDTRTVCVRVCDDDAQPNSCDFAFTDVTVENADPEVLTFPAATVVEGGTVVLSATGSDAGGAGDPLSFAFDCEDDGVINGTDTASPFTQSCTYPRSGTFTARVTVTDGDGGTTTRTTAVVVTNAAPAMATATAANVAEGTDTVFVATATDAGGDALVFEFDVDNNGTFDLTSTTGTASHRYTSDGLKTFTVRVCDTEGACDLTPITSTTTVSNVAPVINAVNAPTTSNEGASVTVSTTATDAGNDVLGYSFTFTSGATTVRVPAAGTQASSVASATLPENGTWTLVAAVTDTANAPNSASTVTSNATITVANVAPVVTSFAGPASVVEGGTANLVATATDAAGANDPLTFAFDCTDDGTVDFTDTTAPFAAACVYGSSGNFTARVTVTDGDGGSSDRTTSVRVDNAAPVFTTFTAPTVNEGATTVFTVSGASDVGGDSMTAQIDFENDGVFDVNSGVSGGTATASFRYTTSGTRTAAARVCDSEGLCSAVQTATVTVTNLAPVIVSVNAPDVAVAGAPVTANVTATDPGNDTLTYTFSYRIGASVVAIIGPQGSSSATTTFSQSGTYALDVTVSDGTASDTETVSFTVTELGVEVVATANPNPVDEGGSATITAIPSGTGPYRVSFDMNGDGDFTDDVDTEDFACDGDALNPCAVVGLFAQNRPDDIGIRIRLVVVDEGNGDATSAAIVSLEVLNVAPVLDPLTGGTVEEGQAFTVTAQASDVGVEDTLTFSLVTAPEGMAIDEATGEVTWTPGYADEGDNDVVVRVTDSDGAAASDDQGFTVTVTIIDTNDNGLSDTFEREVNGGELFPDDAEFVDSDGDGRTDLEELLDGTDPTQSDAPFAPTVISPVSGAVVTTVTPTLTVANAFTPRGLALTYTFCVVEQAGGADVGCETDVVEGQSTTSVVFDAAPLDEQGSYAWYAFANDGFVDGAESVRGSFTVDAENVAPPVPELLTPADDASFLAGSIPTLEARAVVDADGDAVHYVFEVSSDDTFTTGVTTSEPRAVPFFTFGEALAVGEYFWRVQATDGELSSAFSEAFSFSINENEVNVPPTAPGIVGPDATTLATGSATLEITASTDENGDAVSYEFEVSTSPSFAGAERFGPQAGTTQVVEDLEDDVRYFWRVRATDGALASDWVVASFLVNSENDAPRGLVLLTPPDGAVLNRSPTAFVVQNATDADSAALTYAFELASDDAFEDIVDEATAVTAGEAVTRWEPDLSLTKGETYFWRVTVSDGDGGTATASASFAMFKAVTAAPGGPTVAAGGGGLCSGSGESGSGIAVLGLLGVALFGARRRRRA